MRYNVVPVPGVLDGALTKIATLDSNAFPQNVNSQTRGILACSGPLDFENNAYYVEAIVSRSTAGGLLSLSNLKIVTGFFCAG